MTITLRLVGSIAIICLGSLQFGYHMAELNSPGGVLSCSINKETPVRYSDSFFGKHSFTQCIPLNSEQFGLITSIFSIGGLIGSFYVGKLADSIGRKKTILIHSVLYFVGSTLTGLSQSYFQLIIGRFISGIGAGFALVVTALLINEFSPLHSKGLFGSMNQVSINVGILFTQLLSLIWANNNDWRWLLLTGSGISILNFVLVILYLYESPLWLFTNNQSETAFTVLHKLRGGNYNESRSEVNSWKNDDGPLLSIVDGESGSERNTVLESDVGIEREISKQSNTITLKDYLTNPQYRPSLVVSTGILVFQQFDGINSIIFYGVNILIDLFPNYSILINCLISVVNVIITFLSAQYVDKVGRKPLLLLSVTFLGLATILMGVGIINHNAILSVVGTFTYISFFAVGMGPIPFLLVGEVTQPKAKASAQSWGTSMNWVATFIVGYLFPILKERLGGYVYFIFLIMCGLSFWFIKTKVPETKGKLNYNDVWQLY